MKLNRTSDLGLGRCARGVCPELRSGPVWIEPPCAHQSLDNTACQQLSSRGAVFLHQSLDNTACQQLSSRGAVFLHQSFDDTACQQLSGRNKLLLHRSHSLPAALHAVRVQPACIYPSTIQPISIAFFFKRSSSRRNCPDDDQQGESSRS